MEQVREIAHEVDSKALPRGRENEAGDHAVRDRGGDVELRSAYKAGEVSDLALTTCPLSVWTRHRVSITRHPDG